MAENSKISWTHHTFNPWIGCTEKSPGCAHCYAKQLMDIRWGKAKWGPNGTRNQTADSGWDKVRRINKKARELGIRQRMFCASLADIFEDHPLITNLTRRLLFELIEECKNLDWLLLTKRPENIAVMIDYAIGGINWVREFDARFPHVMLGASVENQECADERIPILCDLPGKHFLSAEPLLSPLDLNKWIFDRDKEIRHLMNGPMACNWDQADSMVADVGIHWVIVGGESGQKCRPMDLAWVRSIRDQCKSASVPFFMKQLGGWPNPKEELEDFPEDLRIREFPTNLTAVSLEG